MYSHPLKRIVHFVCLDFNFPDGKRLKRHSPDVRMQRKVASRHENHFLVGGSQLKVYNTNDNTLLLWVLF